jgi:hypothetical protein
MRYTLQEVLQIAQPDEEIMNLTSGSLLSAGQHELIKL